MTAPSAAGVTVKVLLTRFEALPFVTAISLKVNPVTVSLKVVETLKGPVTLVEPVASVTPGGVVSGGV